MLVGRNLAVLFGLLARNRKGALAINFALIFVPLSVLACGAIDMASVLNDRQRMQRVADSTALDAAAQLVLSDTSGVASRADAFAKSQLQSISDRVSLTSSAVISEDGRSVTVAIDGHRGSFFANMLPPGGWHLTAKATAASMGSTPLCILDTGAGKGPADSMIMDDGSLITAPGCLVHSDSDIRVMKSARLKADVTQAVGAATGAIDPAALTGAVAIADPFASMPIDIPRRVLICNPLDLLYDLGVTILTKGVHCGNITVAKNAVVQLQPGDHYFAKGKLTLQEGATLKGSDVALIFDKDSHLDFKDSASIELEGRKTGTFAGFVIATTRANKGEFHISSNNARKLLGTIYVPSATLAIEGTGASVADQSAWTVVVADAIHLKGSPNLVINSNYAGASVPVPAGVGRNRGVVLTK